MNKKQFYILTTCCLVALLVLFEVVLFIAFGGERLEQSGWVLLSFLRDYIIKVKFGGSNE